MHRTRTLLLVVSVLVVGCVSVEAPDDRAYLYGLSAEDVVTIHDRLAPARPIEYTADRLTEPFDCSLFGDMCDQVGYDQAVQITGELAAMALADASDDDIEAHLDARLQTASAAWVDQQDERIAYSSGSSKWYNHTAGSSRLLIRHGVTLPIGSVPRGWTQAKTQVQSYFGIWMNTKAQSLCVNTGRNDQAHHTFEYPSTVHTDAMSSIDPPNRCTSNAASYTSYTHHLHNQWTVGWYTIRVRGCATASLMGRELNGCAPSYVHTYD